MNILQSWKQSLSLFGPANFVQFVRDVVRGMGDTYVVLFRNWYLLLFIVPVIVVDLCIGSYFKVSSIVSSALFFRTKYNGIILWEREASYGTIPMFDWLLFVLYVFFIMSIVIASRPNILFDRFGKNRDYFKFYIPHFLRLGLLVFIIWCVGETLENGSALTPSGQERLFASICAPLYMFLYSDTNGSFKELLGSFVGMIKWFIYNAPLALIMFLVWIMVAELPMARTVQEVIVEYSHLNKSVIAYFFVWPLVVNIWADIYFRTVLQPLPEWYSGIAD